MLDLQSPFTALVGEGGGDDARIDLIVRVVRQAASKADALNAGERLLDLGAEIPSITPQVDKGNVTVVVLMIVVVIFLTVIVAAAVQAGAVRMAVLILVIVSGQPILTFLPCVGQARIGQLADP